MNLLFTCISARAGYTQHVSLSSRARVGSTCLSPASVRGGSNSKCGDTLCWPCACRMMKTLRPLNTESGLSTASTEGCAVGVVRLPLCWGSADAIGSVLESSRTGSCARSLLAVRGSACLFGDAFWTPVGHGAHPGCTALIDENSCPPRESPAFLGSCCASKEVCSSLVTPFILCTHILHWVLPGVTPAHQQHAGLPCRSPRERSFPRKRSSRLQEFTRGFTKTRSHHP